MRINLTFPGFASAPPQPLPPAKPPEPPTQVDANRAGTKARDRQRAAANVRNQGGTAGLETMGGGLQTALKALTGQ